MRCKEDEEGGKRRQEVNERDRQKRERVKESEIRKGGENKRN